MHDSLSHDLSHAPFGLLEHNNVFHFFFFQRNRYADSLERGEGGEESASGCKPRVRKGVSGGVTGSDDFAVSRLGPRAHSPCRDAGRGGSSDGQAGAEPSLTHQSHD